jgi:hypothetical protein
LNVDRIEVIDISDPAHLRRVGGNSAIYACALTVAEDRVFAWTGYPADTLVTLDLYQPPPRLEPLQLGPETFQLRMRGQAGQQVRLDRSRNLLYWEAFATVPIPASGQTLIDPVATTEPFLFYRAVAVP